MPFDSTRKRSLAEAFRIGKKVISGGTELGVTTMKLGRAKTYKRTTEKNQPQLFDSLLLSKLSHTSSEPVDSNNNANLLQIQDTKKFKI